MSRHKANKPRRPRSPHQPVFNTDEPSIEMGPAVVEFFAGMKELGARTYENAVDTLREHGVSEEDIELLMTGTRALCIAEIWELDLEKIFMELVNSGGQTIGVRDAITEKLLREEVVPRNEDGSIRR
jgi:uncharacterized protein YutE (UPF0331/DUF86 family)